MRAALFCCLSAIALLSGTWEAATATPIPTGTQAAARFLLATCLGSADDVSVVAQLARKQNWASMIDPAVPENDPVRVNGMWQVNQNGQSYTVTTGTGPHGKTSCLVMFIDPKPSRDGFIAAISSAVRLKSVIDSGRSSWHHEMYQIEDMAPKNVILQLASSPDGMVYEASIIGPP